METGNPFVTRQKTMVMRWHPEEASPAETSEIELMASVLEGRHGQLAAEIAEFLASVHRQSCDGPRMRAWSQVAERVRIRQRTRTEETPAD
jgi:hypothetical protein